MNYIGIEHIEPFVDYSYREGATGDQIATIEGMLKATGKWDEERVKLYFKHFDIVFDEVVIKPLIGALSVLNIYLPEYKIKVEQSNFAFKIDVENIFHQSDNNMAVVIGKRFLDDEHTFKSISHQIYQMALRIDD